jgi:hypothetical protein
MLHLDFYISKGESVSYYLKPVQSSLQNKEPLL